MATKTSTKQNKEDRKPDTATKQNPNTRPPVVAILGHIDHGKSTLLDYIRSTKIVDKEVGGITQNMSAYEVERDGKKITFLDTPGHEAFKELRGRGAKVADIGILVVSGEDGVKPQTVESVRIINEAKLPYIIAVNKMDKEGANLERTKQSLLESEIYVEGYGGTIRALPISAKTGKGVDELLDTILLMAELEEWKGDHSIPATGVVIEANRNKNNGISGTLMIKDGTLKVGMFVVTGESIAPVRIFEDFLGKPIKEATFSSPVKVIGFDAVPQVGATFTAFNTRKEAEGAKNAYQEKMLEEKKNPAKQIRSDKFFVPVIIKANTSGVLEAIEHEIKKNDTDTVGVNVISAGIGDISENDIKLASGNLTTIVLGFNTKIDSSAKDHAEKIGIEVKVFDIIYKLGEWLAEEVKNRTPKTEVEEERGRIKVLKIFSKTKDKQILGGRVEEGAIMMNDEVVIFRREAEIGRGRVRELQQGKQKTGEVKEGLEFGTMIESKIEIAPGDYIKPVNVVTK